MQQISLDEIRGLIVQMDSLARLVETLDGMSGPAWVQGTVKLAKPLELRAKRDSVTTANIDYFRDWLVARTELAPYGDREGTKLDVQVRSTLRLKTCGKTVVTGLPVESICTEIASAFATEREVVAKLHDVLVYPVGGKFDRHKDTPGEPDQLGSLILAPYVTLQRDRPVMATRKKARALLTYDGMWSASGYFGNEYGYTHVYRIAALRVQL